MITERFKALGKVETIYGEEFDFTGRVIEGYNSLATVSL